MKKSLLAFAIVCTSAMFSSCTPASSPSPSYTMTATAGGTSFSGTKCMAAEVSPNLGISATTVTGGVAGPPQINISVVNWSGGTGTYTFGTVTAGTHFAQYIASSGSLTKTSSSGSVTITNVSSTEIKGTFNFICTDGTAITGGSFTAERL